MLLSYCDPYISQNHCYIYLDLVAASTKHLDYIQDTLTFTTTTSGKNVNLPYQEYKSDIWLRTSATRIEAVKIFLERNNLQKMHLSNIDDNRSVQKKQDSLDALAASTTYTIKVPRYVQTKPLCSLHNIDGYIIWGDSDFLPKPNLFSFHVFPIH